ncbi:MAG TPA: hypothetical protein VGQ31_10960 [Candidatus Limnocylindrales bacterium]|jgi:hypothetical protein|nr:hypothetical protein [Candidatus Limnocylindrales bacterium]
MTLDRDFDRIAGAFLADGPVELPDRVLDAVVDQIHLTRQRRAVRTPWRFPAMTTPLRLGMTAIIGVFILGVVLLIARPDRPAFGGPGPSPTPQTAATPKPSSATVPTLDQSFTSARNGFTVHYPTGWTATRATAPWAAGTETFWGDPALDVIRTGDARFESASQSLGSSQSPEDWLASYCSHNTPPITCGPAITIGSQTGEIGLDGDLAIGATVVRGGVVYDAAIVVDRRGYEFTLDGHVDRALFDALLATISFDTASAVDLPPLTGTFTSPSYGYTIATRPEWKATAATKRWTSTTPDSDFMDGFDVTAGTSVGIMSQPLGSRTFDEFLAAFYQRQHQTFAGSGCDDGGEPSTWPTIAIGDQTGRLEDVCSLASDEALVAVDGRVYLFELGHSDPDFPLSAFKLLLTTVTFDAASAKD